MKTLAKIWCNLHGGMSSLFMLMLLGAVTYSFTLIRHGETGQRVAGSFYDLVAEDCCAEVGKPEIMVFSYLRENCGHTKVELAQPNDQWGCSGVDSLPPTVEIFVFSGSNTLVTLFEGLVSENETFIVDAGGITTNGKFGPNTVIEIYDTATSEKIQEIYFHTSCSSPISEGDQYGSIVIQGISSNAAVCGSMGEFDWGDAPDNYATTDTFGGPYHLLTSFGPYLGATSPDPEDIAHTSFLGDGDDDIGQDEDGYIPTPLIENKHALISVKYENPSTDSAYVGAWFDMDGNGLYDESEYQFFAVDSMAGDTMELDFGLIPDTDLLSTFLRVRISTRKSAVTQPDGPAPDGEVEDHLIMIQQAVLPIELASFDAELIDRMTQVTWTTLSEVNNDYFMVERSSDGIIFDNLGIVPSKGDSEMPVHYQLTDGHPLSGINYYRLVQVDHDGSSSASHVVSVEVKNMEKSNFSIYPNPVNDRLTVLLHHSIQSHTELSIIDVTGQTLKHINLGKNRSVRVSFDLDDMAPGLYYLKIHSASGSEIAAFQRI